VNRRPATATGGPSPIPARLPVVTSQSWTHPSVPAAASVLPSGLNASWAPCPVRPANRRSSLPVATSQSWTSPLPPAATLDPSGENRTAASW
jgi:hypothetical protein